MSALATQHQKQSDVVSSTEADALKWNTDCVYFLASPLTCKKGAECEYRHSEYARVNPRVCYYWLNANCMNPKCGFRHPPLEGLLGNQESASAGSVQPSHATVHPGVAKQPVQCVFFKKGMCVKGDLCSFLHMPNPTTYKRQNPAEANAIAVPLFSKKVIENNIGEKKFPGANPSKAVKANVDISATPRVTSASLRDTRGLVGYEPVLQKKVYSFTEGDCSTQMLRNGSDGHNSFHNGKDSNEVLRESSPGFDVLVDNEVRESEYYHGEDRYGRRSQERGNCVNEYDPDFSAIADDDKEAFRDQREDRYIWVPRRVSSDERSENILESDLRYRLGKQRKVNGMRSVRSHDYAAPNSCKETPRESSISSNRLQGRIKLDERSNGDEAHIDRKRERGRDRSELSQERSFQAPWGRRREMEDERKSGFSAFKEARKTEEAPSLRKRKGLEEDNSFAAPLAFSEILKRKRAAATPASNNKEETPQRMVQVGDETKLTTEEKTEVVSETKPMHKGEAEEEEVYEGNEEEEGYEGDEYYYEEDGVEYIYEETETENAEGGEVVYAGKEEEEARTVEGGEVVGKEDF